MIHLSRRVASRLFFLSLLLVGMSVRADAAPEGGELPADEFAFADGMMASPLAPLPNASPRQTFTSFRYLSQEAEDSLLDAIELAGENDAIFDTDDVRALKEQALDDLNRAASALDLSSVPPANRRTVGISSVLLLKEILDRLPPPDLDAIPGKAGEAPKGWTLPGTEIRMTRVEGTDGQAHFLFSKETVRRLPEFYDLVRDMPDRTGSEMDFYRDFVLGPGLSTPVEFYRYVLELPDWMRDSYGEQAVWQWIAFALLTLVACFIVFLLLRWDSRRVQPVNVALRSLKRMIVPVLIVLLLAGYLWVDDNFVNLTGDFLAGLELVVLGLQAVALSVVIVLAFNAFAALVIAMPRVGKESLDASLIRLVLRVIGIMVAGYVLALAVSRMGVPLYGIIASLGVGGLALALAVRPTLENFIGGIILYADRPVKVGDFCKFGDMIGTVEEIGLRSTKIRSLDRTLVTVQNADFAQMSITNFTRRDSNLMNSTIRLRYETTEAQLTAVTERASEMLREDERVDPETVRVCLKGLGDYALELEVRGLVRSADWGTFLKIQEELLLRVMQIVHEEGAGFALPSQTAYLGTDTYSAGGRADAGA